MKQWIWRVWPLTKLAEILDERDMLRDVNAVRLNSMSADEMTGWQMNLSHSVVPIIGGALAKMMQDHGAANVCEFRCKASDGQEFVLTCQRAGGKTPMQLRGEALLEVAQLKAELAKLKPETP